MKSCLLNEQTRRERMRRMSLGPTSQSSGLVKPQPRRYSIQETLLSNVGRTPPRSLFNRGGTGNHYNWRVFVICVYHNVFFIDLTMWKSGFVRQRRQWHKVRNPYWLTSQYMWHVVDVLLVPRLYWVSFPHSLREVHKLRLRWPKTRVHVVRHQQMQTVCL